MRAARSAANPWRLISPASGMIRSSIARCSRSIAASQRRDASGMMWRGNATCARWGSRSGCGRASAGAMYSRRKEIRREMDKNIMSDFIGELPREARWITCATCGREFLSGMRGRRPLRCPACSRSLKIDNDIQYHLKCIESLGKEKERLIKLQNPR